MAIRKTVLKAEASVKPVRIDELSASQKLVPPHYRLSTLRPAGRAFRVQYREELLARLKCPTAIADHHPAGIRRLITALSFRDGKPQNGKFRSPAFVRHASRIDYVEERINAFKVGHHCARSQ